MSVTSNTLHVFRLHIIRRFGAFVVGKGILHLLKYEFFEVPLTTTNDINNYWE